ncbi:MAG: L,D-transpeptidase [Candidatus Sulfomarinibacteraceae bacterium]
MDRANGTIMTPADPPVSRGRRIRAVVLAAGAALGALIVWTAIGALAGGSVTAVPWVLSDKEGGAPPDEGSLQRLHRLRPKGLLLVIDTVGGRLWLERDGKVLREAACSAGSGAVLVEPGARVWVFDTPLGERRVLEKRRNPVWIKPDWAFVEEGTMPPENPAHRRDDVSLGDYALSLGDGYLIHGTLFQSLLGRPVTHGCVRLGDEDLEYVWRTVDVGTRVLLF